MAGAATPANVPDAPDTPRWSAVYALGLCSFALITSEFLPVSLLSPIAETLHLTEGQAGQAISISGLFAVLTSLSVTRLIGDLDRKHVLIGLAASMIVSGVIVAVAPSYLVLMVGRALLGCTIGGFWSMSAANAMRLVPAASVATALAIVNGGNAIASTVAAPLGSFMGGLIGWRGTFFCVVPIALAATIWQLVSLPSLPARRTGADAGVLSLLRRGPVRIGMLAVGLLFAGQFALFTYLRPFLEQVTHVGVPMLSIMLLVVGLAGFAATFVIGGIADRRLEPTLIVLPAVMAAVAVALSVFGTSQPMTIVLLAIWGFAGTSAPVAWWTWLSRTVPDAAEAGGGLFVAVVQLAITLGATVGGVMFDAAGAAPELLASGGILVAATATGVFASRAYVRPVTA
ncbi:MAG: MFS transporter [Janthinobacterium lividum]